MADSPAAAVSPPPPKPHEGPEPELEPKSKAITSADATSDDVGSEDENQDAASIKTTTADFFPEYGRADALWAPSPKQHKLGLDINHPWGWDGSSYNDYE